MKFKRQYILTLNIDADSAKGADYATRGLIDTIRGCNFGGGGTHGIYEASVHSITQKSINPKRLIRQERNMDTLDELINQMKEAGQISVEPALIKYPPIEPCDIGVN